MSACKSLRFARLGENNGRAKLSDSEVDLLRRMREEGCSMRFLAKKFEISVGYVCDLVNCRYR